MELSIRSRFMTEEILKKRRQMIETENLHIKEKITKDTFKELYSEYGEGLSEKEFAWAFLDIDELRYKNLETGKTLEPLAIIYEYISNKEFEDIRAEVIDAYDLKHEDKITYQQILEMYKKFGRRLSIGLFLEEILGIRASILKNFKKGDVKNGKINFEVEPGKYSAFNQRPEDVPMYVLNPEYIYNVRKRLVDEGNIYVGDSISYQQIQILNNEFAPDMPELLFAEKVLDIQTNAYNALKARKVTKSKAINGAAFQDVDIPEDYIKTTQDNMVVVNKLEPKQSLKRDEFMRLYYKYGGILSKRTFALLVMDMTSKNYTDLVENQSAKSVQILVSRKKTDLNLLREKIIKANNLHYGDMIKYDQFKKIHQMYAPNIPEFAFAEKIFGITGPSFQHIKYDGGRARIYLKLPSPEELKKLQKQVILEKGICMYDKINYEELEELYKVYGGILPIKMFAIEVLGLDKQSFLRIKNHPEKQAFLLFNLEIPRSEIEKIKQEIRMKFNLQEPRKLTLQEIEGLYFEYGGIMSLLMFSREVLGISDSSLSNLRREINHATIACVRGFFNETEKENLKKYLAEGLTDAKVATRLGVTVEFLQINIKHLAQTGELTDSNILYEKVKKLAKERKTPEEIMQELEISIEEARELIKRYKRERDDDLRKAKEQKKQKKEDDKEKKRKDDIERRAIKAVDEYEYTDISIKNVREYIVECKKSFEAGVFQRRDLEFLMECMIFVQCNCREIELFTQMCIAFNEYKMASDFIAENIENEEVLPEERKKLKKIRNSINYAMQKETAIELIKVGNLTSKQISEETGILEVEVIQLRRGLAERKTALIENRSTQESTGQSL